MMKNTEPVENAAPPDHSLPLNTRQSRRLRHERESQELQELRLQSQRRQRASEPLRDADAPLGAAPMPGALEPSIGVDVPVPVVLIGQLALAVGQTISGAIGDLLLDDDTVPDEHIIGSSDRMHHLALVSGHGPSPLPRPLRPQLRGEADALVLPPGPKSRAECRRRCGKAGFCDPSAALGCGGEYCGNATAAAREAL